MSQIVVRSIKVHHSEKGKDNEGTNDIVEQMLDSPDLSENDKKAPQLALEARTLVGAGTEPSSCPIPRK
ncbi:hypothetical protein SBOR_5028 [Sclerotinia borealis F-4128]|uniref:Uncharacterized protein n=1 Tax=Sclerotinia borealis (strain F-4128) TaxID=1432307 RepID=W9CCX1_SCLBF|nr:hypothetical protein SBOR_5028 [Sclerotinia borealis F-4128]